MPNIDELSIEISATSKGATKAIDSLIGKMGELKQAFNLKLDNNLTASLIRLTDTLKSLNNSITELDSDKLRKVSNTLNSFGNSTTKLADIGKKLGTVGKEARETATAVKNIDFADDSYFDIQEKIYQFSQLRDLADEAARALRNAVKGQNLPSDWYTEMAPEEAESLRGYLGIKKVKYDGNEDWDNLKEKLQSVGYVDVDAIGNYTSAMRAVAEAIRENSEEAIRYMKLVDELKLKLESMPEPDEDSLGFWDGNGIEQFAESAAKLQSVGNPFENIVQSLSELNGVDINAERLSGVTSLANSMGKLGGEAAGRAAQSLTYIAHGLKDLSGVTIPNYGDELANLAAGLAKLGGKYVQNAQGLSFVAQGLNDLKAVGEIPNIQGLDQLAASLSSLGKSSAAKAVQVVPQLANSFKQLMNTLSTAPKVSQNTIDLANAMAALAAQGGKASSAISALSPKVSKWSGIASKASKSNFSLAGAIGKVYATYWLLFRAFGKVKDAIDLSSQLTEVQNVVDHVFGDMKYKVEDFANVAIQKFGMAELEAKQVSSRFQAMGNAMGITSGQVTQATANFGEFNDTLAKADYNGVADSMADVSLNLTKLTADMASFYNMDIDEVASKMESVFTGQTRPLRTFGIDLTQASMAEYAMKHGLDANIQSMTQAEKTMLRYQMVMEGANASIGDFARTMNTWANVVRTIGQQFQKLGSIIGGGLINAFRPILIKFRDFMNTLIDLVEKGMNAIGKLLGWQIEISDVGVALDDASEGMGDFGDATGGAAKNAKELNKQIRAWDKLNVLTSNSGDSGGGDGGGGGATGGGGGSSNKVSEPSVRYEDYESDIESWFQLGERINSVLTEALRSIDWDSIFEGAEDFGKNFADFLNGLISPGLFYEVGRTIANSLNTAIYATLSFAQNFDFADFGASLAAQINGFFENFDFYSAGLNLATWITGLGTIIREFLTKIKWDEVFSGLWEGIKGFLDGITPDTAIGLIGLAVLTKTGRNIVAGIITGLFGSEGILSLGKLSLGFEGIEGLSGIGELFGGMSEGLSGFAASFGPVIAVIGGVVLAVASLVQSFGGLEGLLDELKGRIEPLIGNFQQFAEKLHFSERIDALKESFSLFGESLGNLIGSLGSFKGVWELVLDVIQYVAGSISGVLLSGFANLMSFLSGFITFVSGLVNIVSGAINVIGGLLSSIASVFRAVVGFFTGDVQKMQEASQDFVQGFKDAWDGVNEIVNGIVESINGLGTMVLSGIESLVEGVISLFSGLKHALIGDPIVLDMNDGIEKSFEGMVKSVKDTIKKFKDAIVKLFEALKKEVTEKISKLVTDAQTKWNTFKTNVESLTTSLKTSVVGLWEGVRSEVVAKADAVRTGVEEKINTLKTNIETTIEKIKTAFSNKFIEIKNDVAGKAEEIRHAFASKIAEAFTNVSSTIGQIKSLFSFSDVQTTIGEAFEGIKTSMEGALSAAKSNISTTIDGIKGLFNFSWSLPALKTPHLTWTANGTAATGFVKTLLETLGLPTSLPSLSVTWKKQGGFLDVPKQYSLFGMGEDGIPEMLGSVGGKPAVAGGEEITGIRDAINNSSQREMALMREEITLLKQIVAKEFSVSSREVFNATRSEAMSYARRTGNPAFGF